MGSYSLQKTWIKTKTLSMLRGLLTPQQNSSTDAFKTASINVIQKKAKANDDLIGNNIVEKITNSTC